MADQNDNPFNIPKKVVRTYSSDLAKSVQEKGGEAFRIARSEQMIKEKEAKAAKRQGRNNLLLGLGGLALIFISLAGVTYFFSKSSVKLNPEPAPVAPAIIFSDSQVKLDLAGLNKDKAVAAIQAAAGKSQPAGDIAGLAFTENGQSIGLSRLLNILSIAPPKEAVPYINQDYFFGIFAGAEKNWPFLILRTNSYADLSPAISGWEEHLIDDFAPIFGISTAGENAYLLQQRFANAIVSNKETRAIKDKDGNIILMYAFLDEKNILIAQNKETLDEVVLRLYSPKR